MAKRSDFSPTMLSFIRWFFQTLDPKFTEPLLAGRSLDDAAEQVFSDITSSVRGNRNEESPISAADYGAIMDRIAALHLRTRHGEDSVLESADPLKQCITSVHPGHIPC